jgi:hypothetical protein
MGGLQTDWAELFHFDRCLGQIFQRGLENVSGCLAGAGARRCLSLLHVALLDFLGDQLVELFLRPDLVGEFLHLDLAVSADLAEPNREALALKLDAPELSRLVVAKLERAHRTCLPPQPIRSK